MFKVIQPNKKVAGYLSGIRISLAWRATGL